MREARAQRAISEAGLYPTLNFSGSAVHTYTKTKTENKGISGGGGNGSSNSSSGSANVSQSGGSSVSETKNNLYNAGFDASWEIDVFGGLRRSVEASNRDLEATEASLYDTLVSLSAEVAIDYVNVRAYQSRLDLAGTNMKIQKETLNLEESRFQAGLINELSVQQARYAYENTASQIPPLRTSLNETLNRLAVLLGQTPGFVHNRLAQHQKIPVVSSSIAVDVPSEVLRRRPDIRQAERQLAAQTSRIGVAVADLYPKFTINGSLSRQGIGTQGFSKYPTESWSLGPNVSWNLFKAGALIQNVKVQKEVKEQYLMAYESAVLSALEEVENKMFALGQERIRRGRLASAVTAAQAALELSQEQYNAGSVDFTNVLIAEQSLKTLQDQLAQSEGSIASDLISLFKALGGGWSQGAPIAGSEEKEQKRG